MMRKLQIKMKLKLPPLQNFHLLEQIIITYDHDGEGIHDLTSLFRSPIEATVKGRKPKKATVKVSDPIEAIVTGRNSIEATMAGSGVNPIEETVTGKVKKIKKGNKLKRMLWR